MKDRFLIKIDAVDSKKYVENGLDKQARRKNLLEKLSSSINEVFENAEKKFPDGEYVSAQGDCINLITDSAGYAVKKSIEFQKKWFENLKEFPDCRVVIDCGEIGEYSETPALELYSEAFENISVIEKKVGKGEVFITEKVWKQIPSGEVKTIEQFPIEIADGARKINLYKVDYEDPRAVEDDYLVQTIFIADKKSDTIRDRTIGFIILQMIHSSEDRKLSKKDVIPRLAMKGVDIDGEYLEKIIKNNSLLECQDDNILIRNEKIDDIQKIKNAFYEEKEKALNFISSSFSDAFGCFTPKEFRQYIDFERLIEKYLFAVFGDIKTVVSYYNLENINSFYDRFSDNNFFDSILAVEEEKLSQFNKDDKILFKQEFLRALNLLSKQNNKYISSIFHNVLTNFYLNRNKKYLDRQLTSLKKKQIYLDTNTYYSYKVPASQYNKRACYIFDKLKSINANLQMFDITVEEYNSTLRQTKNLYDKDPVYTRLGTKVPWIMHEYVSNEGKYGYNFASCCEMFKIPTFDSFERTAEAFFAKEKIKLVKLIHLKSQEDLSELCSQILAVKRDKLEQESFEQKMLHDANCLDTLKCEQKGFAADNLFVTCDFTLAKLRRQNSPYGNSIITINELYDMLLPYLLIGDNVLDKPERLPNLLLESAIDIELGGLIKIEQIVGDYIRNDNAAIDYKLLSSNSFKSKFEAIEKQNRKIQESDRTSDDCAIQINKNIGELIATYKSEIANDTVKQIQSLQLAEKTRKLLASEKREKELEVENANLLEVLHKYEEKERSRKKYQKKQRKISSFANSKKHKGK